MYICVYIYIYIIERTREREREREREMMYYIMILNNARYACPKYNSCAYTRDFQTTSRSAPGTRARRSGSSSRPSRQERYVPDKYDVCRLSDGWPWACEPHDTSRFLLFNLVKLSCPTFCCPTFCLIVSHSAASCLLRFDCVDLCYIRHLRTYIVCSPYVYKY